jgi:nucleoside-diphosphate-sugar epimerase
LTRTVAIIGAGQIGYAAANAFAFEGWEVTVHARSRPQWQLGSFRRYIAGEDAAPRADVVLDTIAFDAEDIGRYDPDAVGRLIVVSSASVYRDARGRTLDEAAQNGFPEFDGPIREDNPRVAPGPETYSTRKVRMENRAQDLFAERATILRPCAIYGKYSRHPREWWFVKRFLDGRAKIPLALNGKSQFHTTSASEIGEFAENAATWEWGGAFNLGAENPPTVMEIAKAIAAIIGVETEIVPFDGFPDEFIGRTPWSVPRPFTVSIDKALAAGDGFGAATGVGMNYTGQPLDSAINWLAERNPADWRAAFPQLAAYPWDLFDYDAEDRFLASL